MIKKITVSKHFKFLLFAGIFLAFASAASAEVQGLCYSCHTMHNSQNNQSMWLQTDNSGTSQGVSPACVECHSTLKANLLRMDCIGCHAQNPSGGARIINGVPQVAYGGTSYLAAGNFSYMFGFQEANGHNVHGFGADIGTDFTLLNTPPGYTANFDPGGYDPSPTPDPNGNIMCAGTQGCHGDRTLSSSLRSLRGAHHDDDTVLKFGTIAEGQQGTTVGKSYRFLYNIKGGEDSDWENTVSDSDHNEYKGKAFATRTANRQYGDGSITTISEFCSECHGDFHKSGGDGIGSGSSPWVRHPTDVVLPNSGEYTAYTTYDPIVPVASQTIPSAAHSSISHGSDVVMCLSCHRAHASEYADSMRFNYSTSMPAGTGCYVCHTTKDD